MLQSVPMDNAKDSLRLVDHSQNGIITLPNIPVAFLNGLHHTFYFCVSDEKTMESQKRVSEVLSFLALLGVHSYTV